MRKKILFAPLWGIFALSLLSSCRTEDGANTQKQVEDKRFAVFVPKDGKPVNYANGFAYLMKRYDNLHKTNLSGINNKPIIGTLASNNKTASVFQNGESYVEFNVRSIVKTAKNGDKWVVFPKVKNNKVIELVTALLTEKETYVSYHSYGEQDALYILNAQVFQKSLDLYLKRSSIISLNASVKPMAASGDCTKIPDPQNENGIGYDCGIPPVEIVVPKHEGGDDFAPPFKFPEESGPDLGGGCLAHTDCSPTDGGGGSGGAPSEAEIKEQIKDKPFALVDPPCDVVKQWLATAKHTATQSQLDKLKTIVNTVSNPDGSIKYQDIARLQNINDAYSTVVNMDYFPVKINQLPVVNGNRMTPEQFLNHIRTNINNFVDTSYSEFTPYHWYGVNEEGLWKSSNPLGSVIAIDIKGPDNGSVIVTGYSPEKWTFSTIYDPKYDNHPVSGNRDFGYTQNNDGSFTFYTRGVDRLTDFVTTKAQEYANIPFSQADSLWKTFQNKINAFVNSHQGNSSVSSQEIYRPDWDKVKAVIDGRAPLSSLSKDCDK